jgi:two-component system chemotaxis sensor kinase CheA
VELVTQRGVGTTVVLTVPITAAVQRVLLLGVSGEAVALPIARVERIVELAAGAVETSGRESFVLIDGNPIPVLPVAAQLALPPGEGDAAVVTLVLTEVRGELVALRVDRVVGQQQIYVKPVPGLLASLRALSGLTILGDGRPVFVVDPNQVA